MPAPRSGECVREYHTLAQLTHPRIVSVYDYGVCDLGAYWRSVLHEQFSRP